MKTKVLTHVAVGAVLALPTLLMSANAWAVPTYVFGYDATANKVVDQTKSPAIARASFEASMSGLGTLSNENFEGMTLPGAIGNQSPIAFSFGQIVGNAIFPSNEVLSGAATGVFNTTTGGTKFIDTAGGVTISFTQGLAGFGMYLTDLGDFQSGSVTAQLVRSDGVTLTAQQIAGGGGANAGLLFWGFYDSDAGASYSSLIINSTDVTDIYGMDDYVGVVAATTAVPEPGTLALLGLGLAGLGLSRRRKAA